MEEVAWLFNCDFELNLFTDVKYKYISSKMNQEFEYFIHLLAPGSLIFTNKYYSDDYLDFITCFSGSPMRTTAKHDNLKLWWQEFENIELLRTLQNKINTMQFLKDSGFNCDHIKIVEDRQDIEPGFLYKNPKSFSGIGHLQFPSNERQIFKILSQGTKIIKEKNHKRSLDFSTLVKNGEVISRYKNIIDDNFHYKATIIDDSFSLPQQLENEYSIWLSKVLNYTNEYTGYMSIDSYIYEEENLFPVCEINVRKTMGYLAYSIRNKYFAEAPIFKLKIVKQNTLSKSKRPLSNQINHSNAFLLSPLGNNFLVYAIVANSYEELEEVERILF